MSPALPLAGLLGPIGITEIAFFAVIGILLFGKRLPEIGRNLGKTIVEFKKGLNAPAEEIDKAIHEDPEEKPKLSTPSRQVKQIAGTTDEP